MKQSGNFTLGTPERVMPWGSQSLTNLAAALCEHTVLNSLSESGLVAFSFSNWIRF